MDLRVDQLPNHQVRQLEDLQKGLESARMGQVGLLPGAVEQGPLPIGSG